ncbi:non-canonical purine NTP pyrophosphatase [Candidatus Laterigemmans baculatus]|uniref:non-canonical purine NTP pyrophosphatase n=1 Tax=Candidatus Laterigemmans baculatus TaxID=2770505 RepID=UPI0013DC472A|nr:non-canonical purine NTP pyrophosphatase [Candidatus Laterigemmans baculatus]
MNPRLSLLLATTNLDKVREFQSLFASLPIGIVTAAALGLALPNVQEGADSAAENARLKSTQIARQMGRWTLADDTVLEVDALAGRPGVFTARYAGPNADMAANRTKLLAELAAQSCSGRAARFVCQLCVADPSGMVRYEGQGECRGEILSLPRGEGFGYDSLFFIPELGKTMAELDEVERNHVTHRSRAVAALAAAFP